MATLFDIEERASAATVKGTFPDLVDRLAASIRQGLREGSGTGPAGGGTPATRSLEAYRHYLLGQQFANETFDVSAAVAEFKEALAADPEFAMPHLELALLAGWHDAPDEDARSHMESASRNAGGLPDKERRLVLGYKAFIEHRHTEATRILDALALDYPLDKQVLYVAGEAFWHGDTPGGFARAAALFRAALDLDPAYNVAYIHLFEWLDRFGPKGEALARAEKAARFRPSAQAQANVARALGASDRWTDALATARNAASVSGGEHFESAYAQAEALFGAGDRAEGERSLRKWLAPGSGRVRAGSPPRSSRRCSRCRDARGRGARSSWPWPARAPASSTTRRTPRCSPTWPSPGRMQRPPAVPSSPTRRRPPGRTSTPTGRPGCSPGWDWRRTRPRASRCSHPGRLSERQYAAVLALRERRNLDAIEILGDLSRRTPAVEPQFLLGTAFAAEGRDAEALRPSRWCAPFTASTAGVGPRVPALVDVPAAESLVQLGRRDEARAR